VATKAVGYLRVSTTEQVEGFGLAVQEEGVRDYCRAHGLRLVGMESDEGVSGANGLDTRLGLARALAALESGEADVLVVKRLDRLARDLLVQETILERLTQHGKEVRSVDEADITSDDPTRVLVRQVLGAIAQYEKGVIRGRMLAGKAAKRAAGGYTGGAPRFGRRAEGRELVADHAERETVARAKVLRADGCSLREIAGVLEAEGRPTKRGERWHPSTLARLLRDNEDFVTPSAA
jgi:DNA invertase Pin-like site-specific DNA recombinase